MVRNSPQVAVEQEERPTPALQEAQKQLAGRVLDRDKQRLHVQEAQLQPKIRKRMKYPRLTSAWHQKREKDPEMTTNIE